MRGKSQRPKVRRTEPYGPPYNAPMPSASTEESDFALVVEKPKKSRKPQTMQPGKPSSQQYAQDDLVQVVDEKLSAWQNKLALETELEPKYIWGPTEDPSPEVVFRDPDMVHTRTGWDASVNCRAVDESWTMCYDVREGPCF